MNKKTLPVKFRIKRFKMVDVNIGTMLVQNLAEEKWSKGHLHHHVFVDNLKLDLLFYTGKNKEEGKYMLHSDQSI